MLFIRRLDAKDQARRIDLIRFEFQTNLLSVSRKGCEFGDSRNVRTTLRTYWNDLSLVLKDSDLNRVQRGAWFVADVQISPKNHLLAVKPLYGILRTKI